MQIEDLQQLLAKIQKQKTERETLELKACKGGFPKRIYDGDLRVAEGAGLETFDRNLLERYLRTIKKNKPKLPANVSDERILELMGVLKEGQPTVAGLLVFSDYPQLYFSQFCIKAVAVAGLKMGDLGERDEGFTDSRRIEGNIQTMLNEAMEFVQRHTLLRTIFNAAGQRRDEPEYPATAVREAILNALVHRDYGLYADSTPISLEIYKDRLEIRSWGELYGNFSVKDLGKEHLDTRNAALANILETLGWIENRYSGIPTILKEMQRAQLPPPEFTISRGEFVVVFRNGREIYVPRAPRYVENDQGLPMEL